MDNKIKVAQSIIYCKGDIHEKVDGDNTIAGMAIYDLCVHGGCELKKKYLANKKHNGWTDRFRMDYFHAPAYGKITCELGLKPEARERILTKKEISSCIYYIKNYKLIKE